MKNKKIDAPINRKAYLMAMLFVIFFLGELFIYAWCRVQCVKIGYAITNVTDENKRLIAFRENLSIEFERLKSPNRIKTIAQQQLGLIVPEPEQIVIVP